MIANVIANNAAIKASKKNGSNNYSVFDTSASSHGKAYQDLAEANPYANVNYRQSWMQRFLENLGFRTNKDAYLEGMALQAQEYDNALKQKEYDEEYNSASAQAMRLREAGINPDLSGDVSAGESASLPDDGNPPVPPVADDLEMAGSIASMTISGLQAAFGLAGNVGSLVGQMLSNRSKRISNIQQEDNFLMNAITNVLPADNTNPVSQRELYNRLKMSYGSRIKRRYFDEFVRRAGYFREGISMTGKEFASRSASAKSQSDYWQTVFGNEQGVSDVLRIVGKELGELALAQNRANSALSVDNAKTQMAINENQRSYEENVRPELMANELERAQNTDAGQLAKNEVTMSNLEVGSAQNSKFMSDYQKQLHTVPKKILDKLQYEAEHNNNKFAWIAMAVLSTVFINGLPSISKSSSGFTDFATGRSNTKSSTSFSW